MGKFRKKPVVIEAIQVCKMDDNNKTIHFTEPQPEWLIEARYNGTFFYDFETNDWFIETLEGNHKISEGDFIIQGVQGELYPCKPDIFEQTYEPAE